MVAHYLGVPEADRGRFDGWTSLIVAASALGDPRRAADAVGDLATYFDQLIEHRRRHPGDDVVPELVRAGDAAAVSTLEILGFAFTMVAGGNDTATGLLGGALELLAAHPDQRARLADSPSDIPPRSTSCCA